MWTTEDHTVAAGHSVTPAGWQARLEELLDRVAGRFGRVEPRRHARAFVLGLLADLPRKNCWTLAEHAGDASPDGMQHLLHHAASHDSLASVRRPQRLGGVVSEYYIAHDRVCVPHSLVRAGAAGGECGRHQRHIDVLRCRQRRDHVYAFGGAAERRARMSHP
jgi:hypothetical protein